MPRKEHNHTSTTNERYCMLILQQLVQCVYKTHFSVFHVITKTTVELIQQFPTLNDYKVKVTSLALFKHFFWNIFTGTTYSKNIDVEVLLTYYVWDKLFQFSLEYPSTVSSQKNHLWNTQSKLLTFPFYNPNYWLDFL